MEAVEVADYAYIKDDLINANDEKIISEYLKNMIDYGDTWPEHFIEDADVFNKDPKEEFDFTNPTFVNVKPRTDACGKTDGCESGCWRIIGRDKLIKYEDTGKFLGFKKIFKFCRKKTKPRAYKRIWVMEEYRLMSKWYSKQERVICKIRLLFQGELRFLLANHLSIPDEILTLPAYGISLDNAQEESAYYLQTIMDSGYYWPKYVTNNDVYCLHPLALVDPQDQDFLDNGLCIFAYRREASGYTDGCDSGCWRIMNPDIPIGLMSLGIMGFKKVFRFHENRENVKGTWIMEEYRLDEGIAQQIVVCVIKLQR